MTLKNYLSNQNPKTSTSNSFFSIINKKCAMISARPLSKCVQQQQSKGIFLFKGEPPICPRSLFNDSGRHQHEKFRHRICLKFMFICAICYQNQSTHFTPVNTQLVHHCSSGRLPFPLLILSSFFVFRSSDQICVSLSPNPLFNSQVSLSILISLLTSY